MRRTGNWPCRCWSVSNSLSHDRATADSLVGQVRVATGVDVSAGKQLSNGGDVVGKHGDERQYILISPQVNPSDLLPKGPYTNSH
jgi:hypothetical protein